MVVVSHRRRRVYFGGLGQYGDKKLAATSLLNCLRYSRGAFFSRISDIRTAAEKRGKSIVPLRVPTPPEYTYNTRSSVNCTFQLSGREDEMAQIRCEVNLDLM
jgi:hypothetical protein